MFRKRRLIFLSFGLILAGLAIAYFGFERDILLVVDGESQTVRTRALTLRGVLRDAGYELSAEDQVAPSAGTLMIGRSTARLNRARTVLIHTSTSEEPMTLETAEQIPANILVEAGIELFPADRITRNGLTIDPYKPLAPGPDTLTLEYHRAVPVTVRDGQSELVINSTESTIYAALNDAGIVLSLADKITPDGSTRLTKPITVSIERAQPVSILMADKTLHTATTARSVGQLLVEAEVPLQGLDYTIPAEDQPLPDDRQVKVVRVRDEIILEQKSIPFKNTYQMDNTVELDTRKVVTAGEYGIEVSKVRVRLEDNVETGRTVEAAWVAKEPKDQVVGYGTQAVVKTIDTPYGALEYWRAVNVFATSYSPCRLGIPNYCNYQTSSGAQLTQGIVAVTRAWYSWMRGQQVYIPGYGIATIADVGGGIPGRNWVDLGYTDADYKSWASNVTMYFLAPIPASYPALLP